jgi:hypothetical protein
MAKEKEKASTLEKDKGESPTRSSPCHKTPTKSFTDKRKPDLAVKELFTTCTNSRRSSRNKKRGIKKKATNTTADSSPMQANHFMADSKLTNINGSTAGSALNKDLLPNTANTLPLADAHLKPTSRAPVTKNKTAPLPALNKDSSHSPDSLPNPSSKRKDTPNLEAKIPRKTKQGDRALTGKKSHDDDPLSRIDPSKPFALQAGLPNKNPQDNDTKTEPEEESDKQPATGKAKSKWMSDTKGQNMKQHLQEKKAATAASALALAKLKEALGVTGSENNEAAVNSSAGHKAAKKGQWSTF